MQGNVIQLLGKRRPALHFFNMLQFFLDVMFDSRGLRLAGQACKLFRQCMRVRIFDVE